MPYAAGMTRGSRARWRRIRTRSRVDWLASCTLRPAPFEARGRHGSRLLRAAEAQAEAKGYGVVCQLVIAVESVGRIGGAVR